VLSGRMSDQTLDYFLRKALIEDRDAAAILWSHAANSRATITEALKSPAHMIEADVLFRGHEPVEPIMAHPPDTDSDITLQDWLKEVVTSDKGIKLDFKRLPVVEPSMKVLQSMQGRIRAPVWINADVLPGPNGTDSQPVDPHTFLDVVGPGFPGAVLSLGWTTGWSAHVDDQGYSWEMVREMEGMCRGLQQPVTFPVRAALLRNSFPQLKWLLQQAERYSLTVWTGKNDVYAVEDLILYRQAFNKSRIYYDIPEPQNTLFKNSPGYF
ncbi:F151B protein, partial [Amia calva]|nr:F151B protein [Amia calva]